MRAEREGQRQASTYHNIDLANMVRRESFYQARILPVKLQPQLDHARRFSGLNDALRGGRRHRSATRLAEDRGRNCRAAHRSVAGVIEVRVVQGIERFGTKL